MLVVAAFLAGVLLLVDETHPGDGKRVVVTTVDSAGQPVANIPIEWSRRTRSVQPPSEKAERDALRSTSTVSGPDGTATWVLAPRRGRGADDLGCTVFARLPFLTRALEIRGAQGTPARIDVGAIAFAELDVRTIDGRSVRSQDLMLAFDDGTREEHVASTAFARAGDRVLVPIDDEWNGRVHVRAGLGEARSPRAQLDPGSHAVLVLQPAPRLVATLLSPGNEPIRNTDVDLVPIDPGAKLTCLFEDWFAKVRKPDDARVTSIRTDADGAMSVAVPFDPRSSPNVVDRIRQLDRFALRIEVHHPFGACWIARLPVDAAVESGTTDLGAIRLVRDEWMVCGRVVDDRGEPIEGAAMTSSESEAVTIGIGNKGLPTRARTLDADRSLPVSANGVIRFAIPRRTASLTCEADGYPPVTGVYAHGEHVVVLEKLR
ncbi:MAG: hypothetical protein IPH13_09435 [Planctomycetes bacterium]|nr:hypothetical protein [Planctomycetota bacterium]MCC7171234.1 hypothetical protein [Planctomycetota bacterium]